MSDILSKIDIGFRAKYVFFVPILIKFEIFRWIFEKYSNIKFDENPSSGSQVVPCGRTETDRPM